MRLLVGVGALLVVLAACSTGTTSTSTTATTTTVSGDARDVTGNLLAGNGWELLDFTRSGLTYGVAALESEADVTRMWESLSFDVAAPRVDFATHVVIVLGHAVSSSCPEIQFQGLSIEPDRVYGNFTFMHDRQACTADANPAAYLLAVERTALPDVFVLSLEEEDVCGGCAEDTITVDLTSAETDGTQWWARGRFGIVLGGAPPVSSHVFTMRIGDVVQPLAILAADWPNEPTWYTGGETFPDRVEAFTADCTGEECIEDLDLLVPAGPVCGANIEEVERQDLAIIITFDADGSCDVELRRGTDGREFS